MRRSVKKMVLVILAIIILVLSTACGTNPESNSNNEAVKNQVDRVTVQLKWLHNPQFAGLYIADRQGYYQDENIAVTFLPGGPTVNRFEGMKNGKAQFGIGFGDEAIREIASGTPAVIIGATYQKNPYAYFALMQDDKPRIQKAEDWKGLKVTGPDNDVLLFGILDSFGLTSADIQKLPNTADVGPLVRNETDVLGGFLTNQALALQAGGYKLQTIRPEDYGVLAYQDVMFTTTDLVKNNPDLVRRFMRATIKGWQYALEHDTKEVVAAVVAYDASADVAQIERNWNAAKSLIDDGKGLLRLDRATFESMVNLMTKQGVLKNPIEVNTLFTNDFISK